MPASEAERTEKFIVASLLAHLALLVVILASNKLFPSTAKLYLPAIQVDMVALPSEAKTNTNQALDPSLPVKDKTPPPEPAAPPPPKEVMAPIAPPAPAAKAVKTKNPEVAAESAIEKLRREVKQEKAAEQQKQQTELKKFQERYRSVNRGNQVHQGTSMSGTMEATLNAYAAHITDRLRSNWTIPFWLQSEKLRAAVRINIDAKGNVVDFQFIQKSGNQVFDDCVKSAIQRSSPFFPPPAEMAPGLRSAGMEVLFPI